MTSTKSTEKRLEATVIDFTQQIRAKQAQIAALHGDIEAIDKMRKKALDKLNPLAAIGSPLKGDTGQ